MREFLRGSVDVCAEYEHDNGNDGWVGLKVEREAKRRENSLTCGDVDRSEVFVQPR
jgi:hypothetical protein